MLLVVVRAGERTGEASQSVHSVGEDIWGSVELEHALSMGVSVT